MGCRWEPRPGTLRMNASARFTTSSTHPSGMIGSGSAPAARGPVSRQSQRNHVLHGGGGVVFGVGERYGHERFAFLQYKTRPRYHLYGLGGRPNLHEYTRSRAMTISRLMLPICLAATAGTAGAQAVSRAPSRADGSEAVQRLSWLAGCWRRQTPATVVE